MKVYLAQITRRHKEHCTTEIKVFARLTSAQAWANVKIGLDAAKMGYVITERKPNTYRADGKDEAQLHIQIFEKVVFD